MALQGYLASANMGQLGLAQLQQQQQAVALGEQQIALNQMTLANQMQAQRDKLQAEQDQQNARVSLMAKMASDKVRQGGLAEQMQGLQQYKKEGLEKGNFAQVDYADKEIERTSKEFGLQQTQLEKQQKDDSKAVTDSYAILQAIDSTGGDISSYRDDFISKVAKVDPKGAQALRQAQTPEQFRALASVAGTTEAERDKRTAIAEKAREFNIAEKDKVEAKKVDQENKKLALEGLAISRESLVEDRAARREAAKAKSDADLAAKFTPESIETYKETRKASDLIKLPSAAAQAKTAKQEESRTQAIGLADDIIASVTKSPSVVGITGLGRRVAEVLPGTGTEAHDFQQKILELQSILRKTEAFGGSGGHLKLDAMKVDKLVQGLGPFTSPDVTISSMQQIKRLLGGEVPPELAKDESRADLGNKAFAPGTVRSVKSADDFMKKYGLQ